jgi:WD40 repeat protein
MSRSSVFLSLLLGSLFAVSPAAAEYGLREGYTARKVVVSLSNPSSIDFHPDGHLTVCDSGYGRVLLVKDGEAEVYAKGFPTQYWKTDAETGTKRFRLGPLSAVWIDGETLAVTNAGLNDGEETVLFLSGGGEIGSAPSTNSIGPTSDDEADKGEGNLCGMSLSKDGKTLYLAGQGSDAKTWTLAVDIDKKKLMPLASADEAGIEINSPMDTMQWDESSLLTLYSGAGGKEDGLLVQWDLKTKKPVHQWTLPGLKDPMGFARIPGSDELVVVDNNWALTEVQPGKLARVSLPAEGEAAEVEVLGDQLLGPVSCKFGPDGELYIAQLGEEFDKDKGEVIAVKGITAK